LEQDPALALKPQLPNLGLVDMTEFFCVAQTCTTVAEDLIIYNDKEHVSVPYAIALAQKLGEKMREAAPHVLQN
jgi:hypothetical protein